jgi:hypothetical protein
MLLLGLVAGFTLGLKVGITIGHRAERRELAQLGLRRKADAGHIEA